MSVVDFMDNVIFIPTQTIYESLFGFLGEYVGSPGVTIIIFSVVVNVVLSPIYFQMENSKRANLSLRSAMKSEIDRMKKHYSGRERYYYIRAVYRQFGFQPFSAVFTSTDLYLQIFVFSTVYHFLSNYTEVAGQPLWIITDLGKPDGLLAGVNVLPIIMTVLNVVSTIFYCNDYSERRNAFLLSGLFLVLLYSSPSGLVLYWTTNNAFSMVRNFSEKRLLPVFPRKIAQQLKNTFSKV